jgi:hypothetical protein
MFVFNGLKKIIGVQIKGARLLALRLINQFLTTLWPGINAAWQELIIKGLTDAAGGGSE